MRRKLPKTTDATIDEVRAAGTVPPRPAAAKSKPAAAKRPAPAKPKPAAGSPAAPSTALVELPPPAGLDAALRRALAREIVERFSTYSAVGCIVPVPLFEMATLAALVYRMNRVLAAHYAVELPRGRSRGAIAALICALFPTELGYLTSGLLTRLIPGANLVGFAVASVSAVALTRASGYALIHLFESGETEMPTDIAGWRERLRQVMA